MSPILGPDGAYTDTGRGVHPAAQIENVDAAKLPQREPDPYRNVNPGDFRNLENMGMREMLTMADIATSRDMADVAGMWKAAANELAMREATRADQSTATRQTKNRYVGPAGRGIVAPKLQTPWASDEQYRDLEAQIAKATSKVGWEDDFEARDKVAGLRSSLLVREEAARRAAIDAGHWTSQDENMLAANQSLHEKAAKVAAQVKAQ